MRLTNMQKESVDTKVIIAGAGPGDADLITVKAARYLEKADYILVDRLVNKEILSRYAKPAAEIIYVGKHGGRESTPQEKINQLLVEYGKKPGLTLRLKGGDVAFFSNVLDEIEVLQANGLFFEIVPGITAASGASAAAGVPLTARGLAKGVRFLTFNESEAAAYNNWEELANTSDTLVFYMGVLQVLVLLQRLSLSSADLSKPVAVIEQATTPFQRIVTTTLENYYTDLADQKLQTPALIIVGNVLQLYKERPMDKPAAQRSFFVQHKTGAHVSEK
jgi:uroporphyrin-III C-methyltransferase